MESRKPKITKMRLRFIRSVLQLTIAAEFWVWWYNKQTNNQCRSPIASSSSSSSSLLSLLCRRVAPIGSVSSGFVYFISTSTSACFFDWILYYLFIFFLSSFGSIFDCCFFSSALLFVCRFFFVHFDLVLNEQMTF